MKGKKLVDQKPKTQSSCTWVNQDKMPQSGIKFENDHLPLLVKKSKQKATTHDVPYDVILKLFLESVRMGFICPYCGNKIMLGTKYPYAEAPSLDHMTPTSQGGTNGPENLCICCHLCNITKGTMSAESWNELMSYIPKHRVYPLFYEFFGGKMRDCLDRKGEKKNG